MIGESRDCEVIECMFCVWVCVARDQFASCVVTSLRRAQAPNHGVRSGISGLTCYRYGETAGAGPHR